MKPLIRLLLGLVTACLRSSCLFNEPVFRRASRSSTQALGGVWFPRAEMGDPRKMEFAVCAPRDDERLLIHHPSAEKGGFYYEGEGLKIGRTDPAAIAGARLFQ